MSPSDSQIVFKNPIHICNMCLYTNIYTEVEGSIGQNFQIWIKSTWEVPCIILVILLQVEKLCQNKKLTLGSKNLNQYRRQTGQRRAAGGVLKCLGPQQVCCGEDGEMRRYFKGEASINV